MKQSTPELTKLPARTVITITAIGHPQITTAKVMPVLYGTAYGTKFKVFKPKGKQMVVGHVSAFWPDAHLKPKSKWTALWNLEVSPFVRQADLIQKQPATPVKIKKFPACTVAQILHVGTYRSEGPNIKKLHAFIADSGYVIDGFHEEVYLSRPGPKAKTIIRYVVRKAKK